MRIYLEPSALFKAYWPGNGSENMEVLRRLPGKAQGITSCWTMLEVCRGFLKRRSLGEISEEETDVLVDSFSAT